jgi:hypothetical protein
MELINKTIKRLPIYIRNKYTTDEVLFDKFVNPSRYRRCTRRGDYFYSNRIILKRCNSDFILSLFQEDIFMD